MELSVKCKHNPEKLLWCCDWPGDRLSAEKMDIGELSIPAIKHKHPGNTKALIDLCLIKLECKKHCLGKFLDARNITTDCKAQLRVIFASHKSYREKKPLQHTGSSLLTFMAFWPQSAKLAFDLFESTIYAHTSEDEAVLRTGMRNAKHAAEIMEELLECQYHHKDLLCQCLDLTYGLLHPLAQWSSAIGLSYSVM